jgi:hypothetical protein
MENGIEGWHAGYYDEEIGFDHAPVDCGGVVVCVEVISRIQEVEIRMGPYTLGLRFEQTGSKRGVWRS